MGIAHSFEGAPLRKGGVQLPILVLGPALPSDFDVLFHYDLTPTIADWDTAVAFNSYLKSKKTRWKVHIKIDSGMHRYGFESSDLSWSRLASLENLEIEGIYSHIANGEIPNNKSTQKQIEAFIKLTEDAPKSMRHISNSGTLLHYPEAHFEMIRPGLLSYGYSPNEDGNKPEGIGECMSFYATIRQIRTVEAGEKVSYGHRWTAPRKSLIAAVAMGYGDGLFRQAFPKQLVYVHGVPCPIIGTICMDTFMIDISQVKNVHLGDKVVVFDENTSPDISIFKGSTSLGTIPYEQTCRVARRLYRMYRWKGELLRWDEVKEDLGFSTNTKYL